MIDLEKSSGLPIQITDDFQIKLGPGIIETQERYKRKFTDVQPVLMDPSINPPAEFVYYGYRGLCRETDREIIEKEKLSYDLTIMPALMLGDEFNKTQGHYHSAIPGSTIEYPELYEVLTGKALFLLQKLDESTGNVVTVLAIEAEPGDKVIYPPNYGHIIVNIGNETLVTANWVSTEKKADYESILAKHGMALYVVKGPDGKPTFEKNKNYKTEPLMRKMKVVDKIRTDFGLDTKEPMYLAGMKNPKILDFLNHPAKYAVELSALSS